MAEYLGMSADEIRYFDVRTRNPADAVLSWLHTQPINTVGSLYDALVRCDMPKTADLM